MERTHSEPGEGENNNYSHTPDGHERAGPRPAAVAGSDSGAELRSVPAGLNGASAAGRVRPRVGISEQSPATATPSGTATFGTLPVADGSRQQPGNPGVAADTQDPAVAGEMRAPTWGGAAAELNELSSGSRAALFASPGSTPDGVAREAYSPLKRSSGVAAPPDATRSCGVEGEGKVVLTLEEYRELLKARVRVGDLEDEQRELAVERERVASLAAETKAAFESVAAAKSEAEYALEEAKKEAETVRRRSFSPGPDVDALTGMVHALRDLAEKTAKPTRCATKHSFEFLKGSRHPGLKRAQTAVDRERAFSAAPDPKDKADVQSHIGSLKSKILALSDDASDWDFIKARESLVSYLYGLTCLRENEEDGDSYAYATFVREFDKARPGGKSSTALSKLKDAIDATESMERGGDVSAGYKLDTLLLKIDESFVPSNTSSFYSIYSSVLQKLELKRGVRPSRALTSLEEVFRSNTTDAERVKSETQGAFKEWLEKESKDANAAVALEPFMVKVNDLDFAEKSLSSWKAQFRVMEQAPSFTTLLGDVERGSDSTPKARATSGRSSGQGGVHLLEDRLEALMDKISAIEDRLVIADSDIVDALTYGQLMGANAGAATEISGKTLFDDEWVAKNGVPGYAAPNNRARKPINIKALCEACNIPFDPSTLPRGAKPLVGPQCPVCKHNGRVKKWYHHEDSEEFKKGGHEAKKPGERNAAYYHNGGTCAFAYTLAHKTAKADPSKKFLLEPLSSGQSPYGF